MKKKKWIGMFAMGRTSKIALICGVSLVLEILGVKMSETSWVIYFALCAAFLFVDAVQKLLPVGALIVIGVIAVSLLMQLGIFWIPVAALLVYLFAQKKTDKAYQILIREVTREVQRIYPGSTWDWENKEVKQRFGYGQFTIMITEQNGLARHRYWCRIVNGHCIDLVYIESKETLRNEDYKALLGSISESVRLIYPDSVWDWENKEVKNRLHDGKFVIVITDGDGKTKHRYWCIIRNLICENLLFIETKAAKKSARDRDSSVEDVRPSTEMSPDGRTEMRMPDPVDWDRNEPYEVDYSFVAFEWVEEHIQSINERLNEAIAKGETEIILPAEELPTYREAVAKQLAVADMDGYEVIVCERGIMIRKGDN